MKALSTKEVDGVKTLKLWEWGYDRASDYDYIFFDQNGKEILRIEGGWFKKKLLGTVCNENIEKIETDETDTNVTFKELTKCVISDEKPEEEEGLVRVRCCKGQK